MQNKLKQANKLNSFGQVAEWSKAHDWKSCVPLKGTKGSNPFLSAIYERNALAAFFFVNDEERQADWQLVMTKFILNQ